MTDLFAKTKYGTRLKLIGIHATMPSMVQAVVDRPDGWKLSLEIHNLEETVETDDAICALRRRVAIAESQAGVSLLGQPNERPSFNDIPVGVIPVEAPKVEIPTVGLAAPIVTPSYEGAPTIVEAPSTPVAPIMHEIKGLDAADVSNELTTPPAPAPTALPLAAALEVVKTEVIEPAKVPVTAGPVVEVTTPIPENLQRAAEAPVPVVTVEPEAAACPEPKPVTSHEALNTVIARAITAPAADIHMETVDLPAGELPLTIVVERPSDELFKPTQVAEIADLLGGKTALGRAVGKEQGHAHYWVKTNRFPQGLMPKLRAAIETKRSNVDLSGIPLTEDQNHAAEKPVKVAKPKKPKAPKAAPTTPAAPAPAPVEATAPVPTTPTDFHPTSVAEIAEKIGGKTALGKAVGKEQGHAHYWVKTNKFPTTLVEQLKQAFTAKGITLHMDGILGTQIQNHAAA